MADNAVSELIEKYLGYYDTNIKNIIREKILPLLVTRDKYELAKALCNRRVFEDEFFDTKYEEMNDYIDAILSRKVKSNQFNGRKMRLFAELMKLPQ